ncbi:MAG: minor capsid protein [Desulfovibrionaceae bacterium]|nr:minor capsid protein [Desulfovibrionaceae bacterium]
MAKDKDFELPPWEIVADAAPADAAIEYWKQKAKLSYEEAKALGEEAMYRAFYVTGLAQHDLVQLVSDGLQQALENGETLTDFKKRITAAIQAQGWHDYRIENIFRTNMQTAYMAGRYKKMQQVKKSRPYWQYIAVLDKRVRPSHAILHEKVYPADHEFWSTNYPPNGFRCRCTVRTLSEHQVQTQGLTVETEMPKDGVWTDPKTGMEYFVHFPGADKGFNNNPGKDWYKAGLDLQKLSADQLEAKPKKEPVTQKKLQADIEAIDGLIGYTTDQDTIDKLKAEKEAKQKLLEQKKKTSEKKKLKAQNEKLEAELVQFEVKTYAGIWQDDVTTADWYSKAESIPNKKQYFKNKLSEGGLTPEDVEKFTGYLKDLEEFDAQGKAYHAIKEKQEKVQNSLFQLEKRGKKGSTKEQRDAALFASTPEEADAVLRRKSGSVWQKASEAEKDALYAYTCGSGGFNRPLRGYEGSWNKKDYKGPGKVDLNYEGRGEAIEHMTNVINRSSYNKDIWLQRGMDAAGSAAFLGLPEEAFFEWPVEKIKAALNTYPHEYAFVSCGSAKGQGFSGIIYRIFCPKGTKMLYTEPFSHYGYGAKRDWDGKSKQESFGYEDETIIQRGTTFRVLNVEKMNGKLTFEIEVIDQI